MRNVTMAREIEAQAEVLTAALAPLRAALAALDEAPERVLAGGCGDSYFAAYALRGTFARSGVPYLPVTAQELSVYTRVGAGDLAVLVSVSGGTRRTVEAARRARAAGARTLALTCNPASELARACHTTVELPYTPLSRRTPHTLDYSVTLLALTLLAERLVGSPFAALEALGSSVRSTLAASAPVAREAAGGVSERSRFYLLGAGPHRGTAMYGAAKFHEAGGLLALQDETENFVHGMNYTLEPGDLAVLVAPDDGAAARAREVALGLADLGVTSFAIGAPDLGARFGVTLPPETPLTPLLACVPLQWVCLFVAERLGLDLEADRAGRSAGATHVEVQGRWMKETAIDDPSPA